MGTRNLTAVMIDGEYKIAQYGQWDGYPSGLGVQVLGFVRNPENVLRLRDALCRVRFIDDEGRDKEFIEAYDRVTPKMMNDPDNRSAEQRRWFNSYISRDVGGDILHTVAESKDAEILLKNKISFAGDSLFCEYAYVIDLDADTLEVFKGFNHTAITEGRFVSGDPTLEKSGEYHPVKLAKSYTLAELPTEEQFLKDLEPDD